MFSVALAKNIKYDNQLNLIAKLLNIEKPVKI
jgi:hypothetical protein